MSDEKECGQQVRSNDQLGALRGFVKLLEAQAQNEAVGYVQLRIGRDFALELCSEIERLRKVLAEAVDSDGGIRYQCDDDDSGDHACCMTATYEPHAPDCWVTKARALLTPNA